MPSLKGRKRLWFLAVALTPFCIKLLAPLAAAIRHDPSQFPDIIFDESTFLSFGMFIPWGILLGVAFLLHCLSRVRSYPAARLKWALVVPAILLGVFELFMIYSIEGSRIDSRSSPGEQLNFLAYFFAPIQCSFAVALLCILGWHVARVREGEQAAENSWRSPLCGNCGYSMKNNASGVCPECGRSCSTKEAGA